MNTFEETCPIGIRGRIDRTLSGVFFSIVVSVLPLTAAHSHSPSKVPSEDVNIADGFGGPFMLVNHHGDPAKDTDFLGKLMLVYFGYTHCPDICPIDARNIGTAIDLLGDASPGVQPVFITIDPKRDDPKRLAEWLGAIHPRFIGLTGTPDQVAAVAKAYKVVFKRVETASGYDYAITHPGLIYMMDADGHFLFLLPPGTDPETIATEIRALLPHMD